MVVLPHRPPEQTFPHHDEVLELCPVGGIPRQVLRHQRVEQGGQVVPSSGPAAPEGLDSAG